MNGREILTSVARGGQAPYKPTLVWAGEALDSRPDGLIVESPEVAMTALAEFPESLVIVKVLSPLARELANPQGLLQKLHDEPSIGEALLGELVKETKDAIEQALDTGCDGIAYFLSGAAPQTTTPMEYGGHFLEVDREILSSITDARFVLLWVDGKEDPYLDFVIDLPAHAFGWDIEASGVEPATIRPERSGVLAGSHADADIILVPKFDQALPWIASQEVMS